MKMYGFISSYFICSVKSVYEIISLHAEISLHLAVETHSSVSLCFFYRTPSIIP